jgi:hypothetical protein
MKIRCRNCGIWHPTQECDRYGPMFPAPGRTSVDYADIATAIADRVAADIVNEHLDTDSEEGPILAPDIRQEAEDADNGS